MLVKCRNRLIGWKIYIVNKPKSLDAFIIYESGLDPLNKEKLYTFFLVKQKRRRENTYESLWYERIVLIHLSRIDYAGLC